MIPGVQKGGTGFLARLIGFHPQMSAFKRESHVLDNSRTVKGDTIRQCDVWNAYNHSGSFCEQCEGMYFDKSPRYLWLSHLVPQRLACVIPKPVKLLIPLRNPSSRAYSQYQMHVRVRKYSEKGTEGEFYNAIVWEREKLEWSGIQAGMPDEEGFRAWKKFHRGFEVLKDDNDQNREKLVNNVTVAMKTVVPEFLSRGLYAMQLSQWMDTLSKLWGMSRDELMQRYILILDSDTFKTESPQEIMNLVLDFLELSPFQYSKELIEKASRSTSYRSSITVQEREFLDQFFLPYNADLHRFLAPYGIEIGFAKEAAMKSTK